MGSAVIPAASNPSPARITAGNSPVTAMYPAATYPSSSTPNSRMPESASTARKPTSHPVTGDRLSDARRNRQAEPKAPKSRRKYTDTEVVSPWYS